MLGGVLRKTLRDSWLPMLAVGGLLGTMLLAGGGAMASAYGTPATRLELATMSSQMPPMMRGVYGNPVNVDTLGGFLTWHYGSYVVLIAGLWSILALSSTLAGEARRGSLELVVTSPISRRVIALRKVAAHVVALAIVVTVTGLLAWVSGAVFAIMPRDAIAPGAAAAFALGLGVRALVAGSVAFAVSALIGRGAAAGIAGAVMLGGYVVYGYRTVVPAFDAIAGVAWWGWGANHIPLAGPVDWGGIGVTAVVAMVLILVGIEGFVRRDVGVTVRIPSPGLPTWLLGVRGPIGRTFGDLLPGAFWWAFGLAVYGIVMAAASKALLDILASTGSLAEVFRTLIPGIDLTTAAGFLQLAFIDIGFVLFGLAAAMFVGGAWGDELSGRLEVLLATPLSRRRWALASGVGVWLAIAGVTVVLALAVGIGVASIGQEPWTVITGTLVLGLYGIALAGVGMAAGGIRRASIATPVVVVVAVATFLLDTLAPMLRLPGWVADLALTTHLGQPMVGRWDAVGVGACIVVAALGLAAGAWGARRRDVSA